MRTLNKRKFKIGREEQIAIKVVIINGVKGYLDINGVVMLHLESVARGLGLENDSVYNHKAPSIRWDEVAQYLEGIGIRSKSEKELTQMFIREETFLSLCITIKKETTKTFQKMVTEEVLPKINKKGTYFLETQKFVEKYSSYIPANRKALFKDALAVIVRESSRRQKKERQRIVE